MGVLDNYKEVVAGSCYFCGSPVMQKINIKTKYVISEPRFATKDGGFICPICAAQRRLKKIPKQTLAAIVETVKKNGGLLPDDFMPTKRVLGNAGVPYLDVDEKRQLFNIPLFIVHIFSKNTYKDRVYAFSDLVDFELIDNGIQVVTGNSLLGATVGGLTFGSAGAIVGANLSKKRVSQLCTSLSIKLILNSMEHNTEFIEFIGPRSGGDVERSSWEYQDVYSIAQECLSVLALILKRNQDSGSDPAPIPESTDEIIEEIRKYKTLVDEGILTEEEFTAKKKQLLNI